LSQEEKKKANIRPHKKSLTILQQSVLKNQQETARAGSKVLKAMLLPAVLGGSMRMSTTPNSSAAVLLVGPPL
ncbi:hypothetical protein CLOP_g8828, partial [Closterium sp. NIES-67]